MLKMIVYWLIFIAVVLQVIGFLLGTPGLPEVLDTIH